MGFAIILSRNVDKSRPLNNIKKINHIWTKTKTMASYLATSGKFHEKKLSFFKPSFSKNAPLVLHKYDF